MKILLIALTLSIPLLAQPGNNTVSHIVLNASNLNTGVITLPASINIGQNSHQIYAYTADNGSAGACAGSTPAYFSGQIRLFGSVDNVNWIQISNVIDNITPTGANLIVPTNTNTTPLVAFATGVFPYLQVQFANTSWATCLLTVWYTGSTSPQAYTGSPRTISDRFIYNPIHITAPGTGSTYNLITNQCLYGTVAGESYSGTLAVYSLWLYNPAAANTITVGVGTTGPTFQPLLTLTSFQQYAQFSAWPNAGKPYFIGYSPSTTGNALTLITSANTEVDGYVVFRCE
jgi:hypothetical protein